MQLIFPRYTARMKTLYAWYTQHGRKHLPWRNTHDAYAIWVSEIMLQQTQVSTVLERYYFPFLEAFPTIEALAHASQDEVLKAWEGLGYYTRARNLHATAKLCSDGLPMSAEELAQLPGIGRSTANAIACFAYGEAVSILDANVKRILYRYHARTHATSHELWAFADALLDTTHPYEHNQAMMDIGATLCTPKNPKCDHCPLKGSCQCKADPTRYPAPKLKKLKPLKTPYLILYRQEHRYALIQNQTRFLGGLYGFVQSDGAPSEAVCVGVVKHSYSHFDIEAKVVVVEGEPDVACVWCELEEIGQFALSGADKKALKLLS